MAHEEEIPTGDTNDSSYTSKNSDPIPVQADDAKIEDPIDGETADSDEMLVKDDNEAIDPSNVIDERTRGAKPTGSYREPGDDEGLPGPEDGTSSGA